LGRLSQSGLEGRSAPQRREPVLAQGVQLPAIMELLGHSTIALTANTYSHVMPSMMQDMADKMDAIFGE
jgi:integrase